MKERLDEMLSQLEFGDELKEKVRRGLLQENKEEQQEAQSRPAQSRPAQSRPEQSRPEAPFRPGTRWRKRRLHIAAAACFCTVLLTGVCFAADLHMKIAAEIWAILQPVDEVSVYDGIELKTIGAACDEDTTLIYFTMKDTTGQRIGRETDIYDFRLSNADTVGCFPVEFDEATKTGTWCLRGDGGTDVKGKTMTLSVAELIDGQGELIEKESGIEIHRILEEQRQSGSQPSHRIYSEAYENWNAQNTAGAGLQEKINAEDSIKLLEAGGMGLAFPGAPWLQVDNISYEDGLLHIAVETKDEEKKQYNHGYFYLADRQGNTLPNAVLNKPFVEGGREEYILQVDDIEDLKDVKLMTAFTDCSNPQKGEWKVTFQVKGVDTRSSAAAAVVEGASIKEMAVSPMGVTLRGSTEDGFTVDQPEDWKVSILLKNGTSVESTSSIMVYKEDDGTFYLKYVYKDIQQFDVNDVMYIVINDIKIPMK